MRSGYRLQDRWYGLGRRPDEIRGHSQYTNTRWIFESDSSREMSYYQLNQRRVEFEDDSIETKNILEIGEFCDTESEGNTSDSESELDEDEYGYGESPDVNLSTQEATTARFHTNMFESVAGSEIDQLHNVSVLSDEEEEENGCHSSLSSMSFLDGELDDNSSISSSSPTVDDRARLIDGETYGTTDLESCDTSDSSSCSTCSDGGMLSIRHVARQQRRLQQRLTVGSGTVAPSTPPSPSNSSVSTRRMTFFHSPSYYTRLQ